MDIKTNELECIYAQIQNRLVEENRCPRCGKILFPEDVDRNEVDLPVSRYADIQICESCGQEEALNDVNMGAEKAIGNWDMMRRLFSEFDTEQARKIFINGMESNVMVGQNINDEDIVVLVDHGKGMEIGTTHNDNPNLIECVRYDEEGREVERINKIVD